MRGAVLAVATAATACTYRWQPEADCVERNLPTALEALPEIRAMADPPAETLRTGFILCSTHRDRLDSAAAALRSAGYPSYLGAAEVGKCLHIPRMQEASEAAMEREVRAICRIAAASRTAYFHWQTKVGRW